MDASFKSLAGEIAAEVVRLLAERQREIPTAAEYLNAHQVAAMCSVTVKALERMRQRGEGPKFLKVGHNVRYKASDVRAWVEAS